MINVKFFARLRDQLGCSGIQLDASGIASAADVRTALVAQHSHWAESLGHHSLLVAVNQTMGQLDMAVADGDEVAFFPPVTGG